MNGQGLIIWYAMLMQCYYASLSSVRGYMHCMGELWMTRKGTSILTKKHLVAQCNVP